MKLNNNYRNLKQSYLFSEVARRVSAYSAEHPDKKIIKLGIGDVTRPLAPAVVAAMEKAVRELGDAATFRGYGPEQGYDFLREAIARYYEEKNVTVSPDEIFVGDGAKSDLGNILDLFDPDCTVLIPDPVYPVYMDTNLMQGRSIRFLDANAENDFLPLPDETVKADLIYLCSPNNPTGAVYDRAGLTAWVEYALKQDALILYDAAYECFITDPAIPSSIFQIPGAEKCAIEFCSFSKTAGFTGVRCGYTVIPHTVVFDSVQLSQWWLRRQTTKFNGVSYITQRGAEAVFSPEGRVQSQEAVSVYLQNARSISKALGDLGIFRVGGIHSPYVWMRCPGGDSWAFFDRLLTEVNVVGTPGAGFGKNGQGYFRLTGFGTPDATAEALQRLKTMNLD